MKGFRIKRVKYVGDNYNLDLEDIPPGVVVVEGENGSGKSTFASLIAFGLGSDPILFRPLHNEKHEEIMKDKNNFVELDLLIKNTDYTFKRSFESPNEIIVYTENKDVEILYIVRTADETREVFSDWLLKKLEIPFYRVYDGISSGILNFNDLFRLMYYDQSDSPNLYQEVYRSNKVANSLYFRRAIFESFQAVNFEKLYVLVEKYKNAEAEYSRSNSILKDAEKVFLNMGVELDKSASYYDNEVNVIDAQVLKLKEQVPKVDMKKATISKRMKGLQEDFRKWSSEVQNLENSLKSSTEKEFAIKNLILDSRSEIEVTKRLLVSKKQLDFFSDEVCPCCSRVVSRSVGKCICGNPIDEDAYQRFFYHENEYKEILRSKIKSLKSTEDALKDISIEVKSLKERLTLAKSKLEETGSEVDLVLKDDLSVVDVTDLAQLNEKILALLESKKNSELKAEKLKEYSRLKLTANANKESYKKLKDELEKLEKAVASDMETALVAFEKKYKELIEHLVPNLKDAHIDRETYLPILNKGYHLEASSYVPKRLIYYLTVALMGGKEELNHPRFLLIDTPQSKGIDFPHLTATLDKFNELYTEFGEDFQMILTTGFKTLSDKLKCKVVLSLEDKEGKRLLKKVNS